LSPEAASFAAEGPESAVRAAGPKAKAKGTFCEAITRTLGAHPYSHTLGWEQSPAEDLSSRHGPKEEKHQDK